MEPAGIKKKAFVRDLRLHGNVVTVQMHSRFWQREPRTPALIVLIDVNCYVACSRRRVNKAAVKRHEMSQRSFIRSFHLFVSFVRSFVRSFILSFFFISFVRIGRSFILFAMSFVHFVRSCRLFVHAFRSFRLFALASFIHSFYVPVVSRSIFIFSLSSRTLYSFARTSVAVVVVG